MAQHFRLKDILKLACLGIWLASNKFLFSCSAFSHLNLLFRGHTNDVYIKNDLGPKVFLRTQFHAESPGFRNGVSCSVLPPDLKGSCLGKIKLNQSKLILYQHSDGHLNLQDEVQKVEQFSQDTFVTEASSFLSGYDDYVQTQFPYQENGKGAEQKIENLLVCGDGDLSYSASIAPKLAEMNIQLIATVLESEEAHQSVYENSQNNKKIIESCNFEKEHKVFFGIDATDLAVNLKSLQKEQREKYSFHRIQFNFPHWRGKSNHKYNRALLNDFLGSASEVLSEDGQIHIALCQGQGGATASSLDEWRQSWTASTYAAEHGMILTNVIPFKPLYDLSSHRGVDRPFKVGSVPKMYIFMKQHTLDRAVEKKFQLCCSHELHTLLHDQNSKDHLSCEKIQKIIQDTLPKGVVVKVPTRNILKKEQTGADLDMAVYLVAYCGESKAITRHEADIFRARTENEISDYVSLRENRRGRLVSKPFPYPLLDSMVKNLS